MKQRFVPFGTVSARAEFRDYAPARQESALEAAALFDAIVGLVEAFDIDDGVFFLAWEIATLPRDLSDEERKITLMFLLATLVSLRQGSTCLPLEEGLRPLLATLMATTDGTLLPGDSDEIFTRIVRLLRAGKLDEIVAEHGDEFDYKPLIMKGDRIYHQRMLHYEQRLIDVLAERLSKQGASIQTDGIEEHLESTWRANAATTLTAEQRYAVLTAVHLPLTIITGGPGTGKTSIVVAILRLMTQLGVQPEEISLAAPTGKAANRMMESIESQWSALSDGALPRAELLERLPKPQTVHRMLGYSGQLQHYHHQEYNPLGARVVIVDEASMIDIFLMERLVRALRPDAHLVLLGDADQLPSVEAGSVLRDMTANDPSTDAPWRALLDEPPPSHHGAGMGSYWTVRLTHSHRMRDDDPDGRAILHAANTIRQGDATRLMSDGVDGSLRRVNRAEALRWCGAEWLPLEQLDHEEHVSLSGHGERLTSFLRCWCDQQLRLEELAQLARGVISHVSMAAHDLVENPNDIALLRQVMNLSQRSRLLALTRVYNTGTRALNALILERLRYFTGARATDFWLPGAPVMMLRNDYEREIFNGDQGIIMPALHDGREELMVFFPRGPGFVAYGLESLRAHLELSFAMTVHKSQGSEFERVAFVLPPEPLPLLTREVLYTAMTRSKRGALVVGAPEVLEAGVRARMRRFSALGEALTAIIKTS